jgi:hypothetical protein
VSSRVSPVVAPLLVVVLVEDIGFTLLAGLA